MNLFELAKQREEMMAKMYRGLVAQCNHSGMRAILSMLAQQEEEHYDYFSRKKPQAAAAGEGGYDIDMSTEEVVAKFKADQRNFRLDGPQIDLYRQARDQEIISEQFYKDLAVKCEDKQTQKLLYDFASEERKHYLLLNELLDLIERPEKWVEAAEFNHHRDLY